MQTTFNHDSVLLETSVEQLITDPNGTYIDGTFGRGGHTRLLLSKLGCSARVLGFDKDPQAFVSGQKLAEEDARFSMMHASFCSMQEAVEARNWQHNISGVLLDLGVSSPQLDDGSRGFSFLRDGPLDMRMDTSQAMSAREWIAKSSEWEIADILWRYGEERFSRRIAAAIVRYRANREITRTGQLADIVAKANPKWEKHKHPATRAFQAIRIAINDELQELARGLEQILAILKPGGRLAIISFHSLEDRIVKRFIRHHVKGDQSLPAKLPIPEYELNIRLQSVGKVWRATDTEKDLNPRSRSAIMRVAQKIR